MLSALHQSLLLYADHGVSGEAMAEAFDAFERGKTGIMSPFTAAAVSNQTIQESMRLILLVRAYQVRACRVGMSLMPCAQLRCRRTRTL